MSKDLNIIGLQPTMEIAPTQLTIGATSTANELKLETTYNNLLEDGSTIFTTVGGITTPHVVGTVVKTQGTAPVTTTKTITGNTTTINNSPFNNSTVPTLGNMIIVSNTARAIADNASATTFNFNLSSGNDILELQPSMKILLESIEIDPASTTSSLVLNSPYNNYIVDGTPLILDQAGIVTQVIAGTVVKTATTTPTNVTFTITGATTSLPTLYAFNSSNVTVSNMTIASNVATATANAASATTFEYTASGDVTEAQPIAILQPTELDIDPSSTTGSIKVNYTTNNLLQVGSKVLVTDGGVTTEETIAAGSQTGGSTTSMPTGLGSTNAMVLANEDNSLIVILYAVSGNPSYIRSIKSTDGGATWSSPVTILTGGNGQYNNTCNACCYANGIFTFRIYGNWAGAYTYTSIATTDGVNFNTSSTGNIRQNGLSDIVHDGINFVTFQSGAKWTSSNGYTWSTTAITGFPNYTGIFVRYPFGLAYNEVDTYICYRNDIASGTNMILKSTDNGLTWSAVNTPFSIAINYSYAVGDLLYVKIIYNNGYFYGFKNLNTVASSNNVWRSADLTNFDTLTNASAVDNLLNAINSDIYLGNAANGRINFKLNGTSFNSYSALNSTTGLCNIYSNNNTLYNPISKIGLGSFQFTITSPSLPVPDAMYLGGQVLQTNVGGAGWVTHTVTYSDSSGTITFTGNNRTGLTGDTVQVRMTGINNTEVLSYFRGNLVVETADGYTYTCSAFDTPLTSVPVKAYKGGQTLLSSCTATNTPSLVAVSSYTYTRSGDIITYTGNNRTGLAGLYVQLRAATLNENDILTYFGYTYLSLDPTSGWTYTCTNINPRLTTLPGDVYYGDQQVQTNVELAGWQTHAVSEIVSIAANTFRVAYTSISSEPGKDVQLRVQDLAEEDEVSRMKLTITQD